jgi:predicted acylesterase/phospholipase RssA
MAQRNRKSSEGIALCFSGGGYRAAAFHLGVLSYLHRVKLLEGVEILSTVSGGTLAGLSYAHALKKKKSFDEFYTEFKKFLTDIDLIKLCINSVGHNSGSALGFTDVITSIADVYDKYLFFGDRFDLFWQKPAIHLQEIIFNATEFQTGIDFRFQKTHNNRGIIGNGNVNISLEEARMIRLADIAAASSCFPGGFEPLGFPYDFKWPDGTVPQSLQEKFPKPLAIMDGGVYDNQGIEAALLSMKRYKKKIGMFIISDTDQKKPAIYSYPESRMSNWMSLQKVNILLLAMMGFSVMSAGALSWHLAAAWQWDAWFSKMILNAFPAVVLLALAYGIYWLRHKIKSEVLIRIPRIHQAAWNDIKHLTINQVIEMSALRVTSLYALASSVFMKRIRGLVYAQVYENKKYEGKRVSNLIYELVGEKKYSIPWLKPSAALQKVTREAAEMPTTLWFNNPADLQNLIACGQYTICYNLIDYIIRRKSNCPRWMKENYDQLVEDWKIFEKDPMTLIKKG